MKTFMCVALLVCVFVAYAAALPQEPAAAAPATSEGDLKADESAWYGGRGYGGWGRGGGFGYGGYGGYGGYRGYGGGFGGYGGGFGYGRGGFGYGGWGR